MIFIARLECPTHLKAFIAVWRVFTASETNEKKTETWGAVETRAKKWNYEGKRNVRNLKPQMWFEDFNSILERHSPSWLSSNFWWNGNRQIFRSFLHIIGEPQPLLQQQYWVWRWESATLGFRLARRSSEHASRCSFSSVRQWNWIRLAHKQLQRAHLQWLLNDWMSMKFYSSLNVHGNVQLNPTDS